MSADGEEPPRTCGAVPASRWPLFHDGPAASVGLTDERQRRLADAVGKLARAELRNTKQQVGGGGASGRKVARRRGTAS